MRCVRSILSAALLALAPLGAPAQERRAAEARPFTGELSLVRYDMPRGFSEGYAPTRHLAQRKDGDEATDWPELSLDGQPIFRNGAEEKAPLPLRKGEEAASLFQTKTDHVIQPGNHWFRALEWRLGRRHIYTADRTARSANAGEAMSGRYELWTFPIIVEADGAPAVKNVEVKAGNATIYRKPGPWRSLTLLLPASAPGQPYVLTVDGRPAVQIEAGLRPVKLGDPRDVPFSFHAVLGGEGPKIVIRTLERPAEFPHTPEWQQDVAALAQPIPRVPVLERGRGLSRWLGIEVPHSPLTIYGAALPHGMSGGFFRKGIDPDNYAALIAESGYDAVFEQANSLKAPDAPESLETLAAALGRHGVKLGLQYDNNWSRPSLQHPNVAFFSHTLPDWHAPLYRSLQLAAQRFARLPNFLGMSIGSDNAGYVSFWHWAPPIPDRPWGEAMVEFMQTAQPKIPRSPSLGARELPFEQPVKETAEFIKYVARYETTFRQYGYFAEAVREVDPRLIFTTGSFGSAPGAGARGGWPWASIPGRTIFEELNTQQVYDWNETHAAKPMHNVALLDRMRSYHPEKRTWTIIDNFNFLYGREAFQRAYALALTRGLQGIGTNFIAHPGGDRARPDVLAWQREFHAWARKFGGVHAMTQPEPVIGIFYGHHQAVQRRIVRGDSPPEDQLYRGSHEGKVTEALFLCHAAGWPARVITFQEMMRGPLPETMKAILLVGLDQADPSWNWSAGVEPMLQQFLGRGGRILADDESVAPVPVTRTEMRVAANVTQSDLDATPLLLARNQENITKLRAAMSGVAAPVAVSDSPQLWAIPSRAGDTLYVTAVNQAVAEGAEAGEMLRAADPKATKPEVWKTKANASLYVKPQTGRLQWQTERPIYDVALGRKITAEEAAVVDLTKDAFRWYALPAAEVTAPVLTIEWGVRKFYEAKLTMTNGAQRLNGIPVEITVSGGNDTATVFGATGATVRLPLSDADVAGTYKVVAKELLTGLSSEAAVEARKPFESKSSSGVPPRAGVSSNKRASSKFSLSSGITLRDAPALAKFATRKHVALTITLTPEQAGDARMTELASRVAEFYRQQGRIVRPLARVEPGSVVESLQPLKSPHSHPRWKTIRSDLILFGTTSNNVLLRDQALAQIFPADLALGAKAQAEVVYTRSPFVGEFDVVNILANDVAGLEAAVKTLTAPAQPK
jgi:hypothetical protein